MDIDVWLAFTLATTALLAMPGPVVMLLLGYCVAVGKRAASAALPGVVLGDLVAMTVSLLGAGAVLQASATLFMALKYAGAAYLIWLGVGLFKRSREHTAELAVPAANSRRKIMWSAFLVTAFNPKDLVFFVAFLPQFIDPGKALLPQILVLETTFALLVLGSTMAWLALAEKITARLRNPKSQSFISKCGATWLVGAGVLTATHA